MTVSDLPNARTPLLLTTMTKRTVATIPNPVAVKQSSSPLTLSYFLPL
jgi:hypothetical protein